MHLRTQERLATVNWDDIQVLLAVAESGSILQASMELGCSHSTIVRRLDELEAALETKLFRRHRRGCDLTPAGELAFAEAQHVRASVEGLQRGVAGHRQQLEGQLKITVVDAAATLLMPMLAQIRAAHPSLGFDLLLSDDAANLERGEADLALRLTLAPTDSLVGRCQGVVASAPYRHRNLRSMDPWTEAPWVVMHESMGAIPQRRWEQKHLRTSGNWLRVNSAVPLYQAVSAGLGCGVLTCLLGDANPDLVRISDPDPALELQLWFLYHRDLRRAARLHTVVEHLSQTMSILKPLLAGEVADAAVASELFDRATSLPLPL